MYLKDLVKKTVVYDHLFFENILSDEVPNDVFYESFVSNYFKYWPANE